MTQQALTIREDQTPTITELATKDIFNIWLPDQSELTQTVYKAEVTASLECCRHRLITLGAENSFSDLYNQ
jgi:hypothetical protein